MSLIRTFVAIELRESVRQAVAGVVKRLSSCGANAKWVDPGDSHLTVKFLGEVDEREVYEVCKITKNVCQSAEPFSVHCRGVGGFPSVERPRTIWIGVDEPTEQLHAIHAQLDDQFRSLGVAVDPRRFHPHLTVGRMRYNRDGMKDLQRLMLDLAEISFGTSHVAELVVFASELHRSGPRYSVLGRCPVGG